MPKRYNKKKNYKKKGSSKPKYRARVPRTLQYATNRPKSVVLKFRKQFVYFVKPGGTNQQSNALECVYLTIRANSIYQILQQGGNVNHAGTWLSQNALDYSPTINCNADGWDEWKLRFQHFTVLGSKLNATYEPQNTATSANQDDNDYQMQKESAEGILFLNKVGGTGIINTTSTMATISKMPYQRKGTVKAGNQGIGRGTSLSMKYSAKRFEGVSDVLDNTTLRGQMDSGIVSPAQPAERSYFNIGILPTIHAQGLHPPNGILRINVEYITKLTEVTATNQISIGRPDE